MAHDVVDRYTCDFCKSTEDNPPARTWRTYRVYMSLNGMHGDEGGKWNVCPKCTDSQTDPTTKGFLSRILRRKHVNGRKP